MRAMLRKWPTGLRVLFGLQFTVFGLNGFLNFLPAPPIPEAAQGFMGGMVSTGYFFPLLRAVELAAGLLLLGNVFVPLALVLLAPIVVNIVAFHAFLAPSPAIYALVLVPELALAWAYRDSFRPMLRPRTQPHGSAAQTEAEPQQAAQLAGET